MDLASSLVRSVARSFYSNEYILIIDALLVHSTLRDDDLAYLMGMQAKHLRKLCGKLREDGLLSVHSRPEIREGAQRPFNRDYYYINFHRAIDVIKYRLTKMTKEIKKRFTQTADEKKEYSCPQCKNEYTQMEVLDNPGPMGFECKRCGHVLKWLENDGQSSSGNEVQSRLNEQLAIFENLMQQIDNTSVPENDFETALINSRPVQRDATLNPTARSEAVAARDGSKYPPATVKGLKTEPEKIQVSLLGDAQAASDQDAAAAAERKAKLAAQNALPAWHTNSTVTMEQTPLSSKEETTRREMDINGALPKLEDEEEKKMKANEDTSALNSYFAALKEEEQRERELEQEEEADEDDGEESGFEDVGIANGELRPQKRVKIQEPGEETSADAIAPPFEPAVEVNNPNGMDSDEDDFEDVI